jgi:hypothetical protein
MTGPIHANGISFPLSRTPASVEFSIKLLVCLPTDLRLSRRFFLSRYAFNSGITQLQHI